MGALTSLSDLLNQMTGGFGQAPSTFLNQRVNGAAATATVAGRLTSLWQYQGTRGFGAVASSSGGNPTNATNGSLRHNDATGGRQLYLLGGIACSLAPGTVFYYDRLAAEDGNSATVTTAQTLTGCSVTRYTGAESVGNEIWIEITALIGTTATTITCSYTNQDGTAGRTTTAVAFGGTGLREAQRVIKLGLQNGDTGVRSVESVTVLVSTGTAGSFSVVIARPLQLVISLPLVGIGGVVSLVGQLGSAEPIKPGACIARLWHANLTTAPELFDTLVLVEK